MLSGCANFRGGGDAAEAGAEVTEGSAHALHVMTNLDYTHRASMINISGVVDGAEYTAAWKLQGLYSRLNR